MPPVGSSSHFFDFGRSSPGNIPLQNGDKGSTDAEVTGSAECSHCIDPLLSKPPLEI